MQVILSVARDHVPSSVAARGRRCIRRPAPEVRNVAAGGGAGGGADTGAVDEVFGSKNCIVSFPTARRFAPSFHAVDR
jgi:hypothetical protein